MTSVGAAFAEGIPGELKSLLLEPYRRFLCEKRLNGSHRFERSACFPLLRAPIKRMWIRCLCSWAPEVHSPLIVPAR